MQRERAQQDSHPQNTRTIQEDLANVGGKFWLLMVRTTETALPTLVLFPKDVSVAAMTGPVTSPGCSEREPNRRADCWWIEVVCSKAKC